MRLSQRQVQELALSEGFTEAGIVSLPHAETVQDGERFTRFVDRGHHGTMHYLARRNEQGELLRSEVQVPFPWARSVIVCLASYHVAQPLSTEPTEPGAGWIARYAWSGRRNRDGSTKPADYHKVLLKKLQALEGRLLREVGPLQSRAYVDTGPIVERSIARAAGLGWTGKNTCLIHPKFGSWNFLAVIVTSLMVAEDSQPLLVPDRCGSCRRCLEACPTSALIEPYQMDATRCISYLTIEHPGEIAEEFRPGMGRQIFGCDICQDVCPWNRKAPIQPAFKLSERGPNSLPVQNMEEQSTEVTREELVNPSLEWLAMMEQADFERLFNGSPVRRAGFEGLRRNVAIAMGNSGLARYMPLLEKWANEAQGSFQENFQSNEKAHLNRGALREASRWALERCRKLTQDR